MNSVSFRITEEELLEYGPLAIENPMLIPRIAEAMGEIPDKIEAEENQKLDQQKTADAEEMLGSIPVFETICGHPVLRPISAALFNILIKAKSPLVNTTDKNGVPNEDIPDDEWVHHQGFVVFLMCYPSVRKLVTWSMAGPDELEKEYLIWSMNALSIDKLLQECHKVDTLIDAISGASLELSSDEEDTGGESVPKSGG